MIYYRVLELFPPLFGYASRDKLSSLVSLRLLNLIHDFTCWWSEGLKFDELS